ncbi:unnamed protein product, partial [Rotaria magnacalcarata]
YNDDTHEKTCFWPKLVNFHTIADCEQFSTNRFNCNVDAWLIENTDLKFRSLYFYADYTHPVFSIWR